MTRNTPTVGNVDPSAETRLSELGEAAMGLFQAQRALEAAEPEWTGRRVEGSARSQLVEVEDFLWEAHGDILGDMLVSPGGRAALDALDQRMTAALAAV